jgi:hypothetical protein
MTKIHELTTLTDFRWILIDSSSMYNKIISWAKKDKWMRVIEEQRFWLIRHLGI